MVPFPMLPTDSAAERRLYEGFLEQLDDAFVIYHSVDWVVGGRAGRDEGEADFVITHPELGLLALEVKGGRVAYDAATKRWTQTGHSGTHGPRRGPVPPIEGCDALARADPRGATGWDRWKPSYGFGVAFPDGRYDTAAHPGAPAEIVIDRNDLARLAERVPR
jgi:hypothetical protein